MKKPFAALIAVAFTSVSIVQAQDVPPETPGQPPVEQSEGVQVDEPSGAPGLPETADPNAVSATQEQPQSTITVSQTFTNDTNSITIIGTVDRPGDVQTVQQSVQQALPGKTINVQLKVASQEGAQVTEPSGAERPSDQPQSEPEIELEQTTPESQPDVDRQFEIEGNSGAQP